jgi:uncharacterized membrane protein YjgN (DUF898 family)
MDDITAASAALPVAEIPRSGRAAFTGARRDFVALVVRGAALELCTAGFYRFWLATAMRRHLWSNTLVDGDALEYTGRAVELLLGFLFALAILVPFYLLNFLIGIEAERYKVFASTPLLLAFYVFYQFAIYRARRYRATRTVWRGTRFWMKGSGWSYACRANLWSLLVIFTLGFALPWREATLERYKMGNTYFGDVPCRFAGTGWELFKRGWVLWLASLLILPIPFVYPVFKARLWKWWIEGVRIGEVHCESGLRGNAFIGLFWKMVGWFMFIGAVDASVIAIPVTAVIKYGGAKDQLANFLMQYSTLIFVANVANYLVMMLAMTVVMRIYFTWGIWERVVNAATLHNIDAANFVRAQGTEASALGEGFADSLDVAGF